MSTEFNVNPDKGKEDAIAAILSSENYIVIVERTIDGTEEIPKENEPCEYGIFYNSFCAALGLTEYAKIRLHKSALDDIK